MQYPLLTKIFAIWIFLTMPSMLVGLVSGKIDADASNQHFFMTFPRSGTNLTNCYIQALTGKPIAFFTHKGTNTALNRLNMVLDYSKTTLYREHHGHLLAPWNKNGNKLLFVLRNYKESIHRKTNLKNAKDFRDVFTDDGPVLWQYINNIRIFHHWDVNNRLLIYYEDLISDPMNEVKKILKFFDEPIPIYLTNEFLHDVAMKALNSYHEQHIDSGGSHSKGQDLEYHTKQLPVKCIKAIDHFMETHFPVLWQNYLKRYKTQ